MWANQSIYENPNIIILNNDLWYYLFMLHMKKHNLLKWIRFDKLTLLWEGNQTAELANEILIFINTLIRKIEREGQCEG